MTKEQLRRLRELTVLSEMTQDGGSVAHYAADTDALRAAVELAEAVEWVDTMARKRPLLVSGGKEYIEVTDHEYNQLNGAGPTLVEAVAKAREGEK